MPDEEKTYHIPLRMGSVPQATYRLLVSRHATGVETPRAEHADRILIERMLYSSTLAAQFRKEGFRYMRMECRHYDPRRLP